MYVCMCTCMYVCMYVCIRMCMYTYVYIQWCIQGLFCCCLDHTHTPPHPGNNMIIWKIPEGIPPALTFATFGWELMEIICGLRMCSLLQELNRWLHLEHALWAWPITWYPSHEEKCGDAIAGAALSVRRSSWRRLPGYPPPPPYQSWLRPWCRPMYCIGWPKKGVHFSITFLTKKFQIAAIW